MRRRALGARLRPGAPDYPGRMRILHVSDCYAPRTGGIETQVRDLARAQAAQGHDVHVLTATTGREPSASRSRTPLADSTTSGSARPGIGPYGCHTCRRSSSSSSVTI